MDAKKAKEIIEKYKSKNHNDEFNKMYEKYESKVEGYSGGLVTTNKADFIKLYAFYSEVIYPDNTKLWKAYLKQ
jgi:hypothetical protein